MQERTIILDGLGGQSESDQRRGVDRHLSTMELVSDCDWEGTGSEFSDREVYVIRIHLSSRKTDGFAERLNEVVRRYETDDFLGQYRVDLRRIPCSREAFPGVAGDA